MKRLLLAAAGIALAAGIAVRNAVAEPSIDSFQPLTWNADVRDNPSGHTFITPFLNENREQIGEETVTLDKPSKTARFSGDFQNFLDVDGKWKNIDLTPKKDSQGFHIKGAFNADLPLKANGDIRFTANNRFDVREKIIRDDAPISSLKKFTDAVPVNGVVTSNGVLYANALPTFGADLLLQSDTSELRYLVVWDSLPPQCIGKPNATFEIPFTQTFDNGVVPRKKDNTRVKTSRESIADGYEASSSDFRFIGSPVARIWDSNYKREKVEIVGKFSGNTLDAAKVIKCSYFSDAVFPVTTDAVSTFYATATGDGELHNARIASYSDVWDDTNASTPEAGDSTARVGQLFFSGNSSYNIERVCTPFDTSALTTTATVTNAVYSIYGSSVTDTSGLNPVLTLVRSGCTVPTQVNGQDYNYTLWSHNYGTVTEAAFSTSGYNNITVNDLDAITRTGATVFGLRTDVEIAQTSPSAEDRFVVYMANNTGTDKDPLLTVTYTAPSSSSPIIIIISFLKSLIPFAYAK